jgi:hypothetical protein
MEKLVFFMILGFATPLKSSNTEAVTTWRPGPKQY